MKIIARTRILRIRFHGAAPNVRDLISRVIINVTELQRFSVTKMTANEVDRLVVG